jgi:hypothetical protein
MRAPIPSRKSFLTLEDFAELTLVEPRGRLVQTADNPLQYDGQTRPPQKDL